MNKIKFYQFISDNKYFVFFHEIKEILSSANQRELQSVYDSIIYDIDSFQITFVDGKIPLSIPFLSHLFYSMVKNEFYKGDEKEIYSLLDEINTSIKPVFFNYLDNYSNN